MGELDKDFKTRLGNELIRQQDRRADHVKSKFTFVIALCGLVGTLQSVKLKDPLAVNLIICAIPLVAALFDLYILGGDFAVKRIRSFLIAHDTTKVADARWSEHIGHWPKDFMRHNRRVTTGFITVACAAVSCGNLVLFEPHASQWWLWSFWLVFVIGVNGYLLHIEAMIRGEFTKESRYASVVRTPDAPVAPGPVMEVKGDEVSL